MTAITFPADTKWIQLKGAAVAVVLSTERVYLVREGRAVELVPAGRALRPNELTGDGS